MEAKLAELAHAILDAAQRRAGTEVASAPIFGVLAEDYAPERPCAVIDDRLKNVALVFDLPAPAVAVLVAALAPDLDSSFGTAYAVLQGNSAARRLTVGLAFELIGSGFLERASRALLAPGSAVVDHGLVEIVGDGPFVDRSLRVPDRVTAHLLGHDEPARLVLHHLVQCFATPSEEASTAARGIKSGVPLIWVREAIGGSGLSLAAQALREIGLPCLAIDLTDTLDDIGHVLRATILEAGLRCAGLVVRGADRIVNTDRRQLRELLSSPSPVIICGHQPWNPSWLTDFVPMSLAVPPTTIQDRAQIWETTLRHEAAAVVDEDPAGWQGLLQFRLTPEAIVKAARAAQDDAQALQLPLTVARLTTAARRLGDGTLTGTSTNSVAATMADLVLPDDTMNALADFISWARHRDQLVLGGSPSPTASHYRGIAALFSGGPGTGKTMAARVVANELGLDLRTVDLSVVVDKYIGETEKRLETIFREAEALNIVLFFDEADALFGSRSAVHDARDRYANQEIAYLLQRLESFGGITVLATNLRGNLDRAFTRRLACVIHFPEPNEEARARLWKRHVDELPQIDAEDPVDVARLASIADLNGGSIRNIVVSAGYTATATGIGVSHTLICAEIAREFRKLGRVVPPNAFG